MKLKRMTKVQRAVYLALRRLDGEMTMTPDSARPLHALKRRGLVRFARDESGAKVARLRVHAKPKRNWHAEQRYLAGVYNFIGGAV